MYEQFTDKIQALEFEISQINERLKFNIQDIEEQKSDVEQLENKLLKARKAYALDDSLDNRKAVSEAQKNLTSGKDSLDNLTILAEALVDKRTGVESELKSTVDALRRAELERIVSKAPELLSEYDKLVRQAYKIACRIKVLQREVEQRKELEYLKAVCPAAANLWFIPPTFFTTKLDPHSQEPLGPFTTRNMEELTGEYHHEIILKELLA
jgi:chromosome segregation ATPase